MDILFLPQGVRWPDDQSHAHIIRLITNVINCVHVHAYVRHYA